MRTKLSDRRPSVNIGVPFQASAGNIFKLQVTFGFDEAGQVREVFCADFKVGSDQHAIVMDACVLLSRLLQHGISIDELSGALCQPPSLIGTIIAAAKEVRQ